MSQQQKDAATDASITLSTQEPKLPRENSKEDSSSNSIHTISESSSSQEIEAKHPSDLQKWTSHISQGHDIAPIALEHFQTTSEQSESIYERFPPHRKTIIVALMSIASFLAPISSTTVLSATPEVAATFESTGTIINLSNALYMLFMGISPCFWGPLSQVYGRRWISLISGVLFCACSIGTALAPNLPAFFIFRILTAFEGTSFLIVGAACIGDIYRPTERATGMGWFLSGTLIGPAFGPFIGGIIVTFKSWRAIFWLQAALSGTITVAIYLILPETIHYKKSDELVGLPFRLKLARLWAMINPWRVIVMLRYPNLVFAGIASGSIVWNMYSLLSPIRYVLNPRFNLTSPIQSGLFYLAPGAGYLLGSFMGGRYADHVVKKYIVKRGERMPEDRLRSCLPFMGGVIPVCMLVYGWSVEKAVGGIPLPVLMMFFQGIAQLCSFPALNTYCLDVMQAQSGEAIAGNYMIRYLLGALGTAFVLPAVQTIGVGWFSTISAGFLFSSALMIYATVLWGKGWRTKIDASRRKKRNEQREKDALKDEGEKGEVKCVDEGVVVADSPEINV